MTTATADTRAAEIENVLCHFIGSENYYLLSRLFNRHYLTDGTHYLAVEAQAYWLMEAIASHQITACRKRIDNSFQVWELRHIKQSGKWLLHGTDGDGLTIARQSIPYSTFPLDQIKLYCVRQGNNYIIMLPSEY